MSLGIQDRECHLVSEVPDRAKRDGLQEEQIQTGARMLLPGRQAGTVKTLGAEGDHQHPWAWRQEHRSSSGVPSSPGVMEEEVGRTESVWQFTGRMQPKDKREKETVGTKLVGDTFRGLQPD